jgi:hypothetical protein
MIQDSFEPV